MFGYSVGNAKRSGDGLFFSQAAPIPGTFSEDSAKTGIYVAPVGSNEAESTCVDYRLTDEAKRISSRTLLWFFCPHNWLRFSYKGGRNCCWLAGHCMEKKASASETCIR